MSLRLYSDLIQWKSIILAAMVSLTRWNAKMLCLLLKVECGSVALVTTDMLPPNIYDLDLMGTPRYLRVYLISMICSVAVLAPTNSDPYVAGSTVACFLEYQSVGVWLQKWRHAVSDAPVANAVEKVGIKGCS